MSDLIDRENAKNAFCERCDERIMFGIEVDECKKFGCALMRCLDKIKTVDAVPVVRCVNCRHCNNDVIVQRFKNGIERRINICLKHESSVADDYFCADGERRKSDEKID